MEWETSGEENEAKKQDRNREADWLRTHGAHKAHSNQVCTTRRAAV